MRVLFQGHDFIYLEAPKSTDTAEIVALEIDEHNVFRSLLLVGLQFRDESFILKRGFPSGPGSCDWPGIRSTTVKSNKALG
jgi:hypothetical protein